MNQGMVRDICLDAIKHYGIDGQVTKCLEEISELAEALSPFNGGNLTLISTDNIVDEIADVAIMILQMQMIFGEDRVSKRMEFKIERLRNRMMKERRESE